MRVSHLEQVDALEPISEEAITHFFEATSRAETLRRTGASLMWSLPIFLLITTIFVFSTVPSRLTPKGPASPLPPYLVSALGVAFVGLFGVTSIGAIVGVALRCWAGFRLARLTRGIKAAELPSAPPVHHGERIGHWVVFFDQHSSATGIRWCPLPQPVWNVVRRAGIGLAHCLIAFAISFAVVAQSVTLFVMLMIVAGVYVHIFRKHLCGREVFVRLENETPWLVIRSKSFLRFSWREQISAADQMYMNAMNGQQLALGACSGGHVVLNGFAPGIVGDWKMKRLIQTIESVLEPYRVGEPDDSGLILTNPLGVDHTPVALSG